MDQLVREGIAIGSDMSIWPAKAPPGSIAARKARRAGNVLAHAILQITGAPDVLDARDPPRDSRKGDIERVGTSGLSVDQIDEGRRST
jgi:hypothetical protein